MAFKVPMGKARIVTIAATLLSLAIAAVPPAAAARACTDTDGAIGYSVSCGVDGTCPSFGPQCFYTMTCSLSGTGTISFFYCGGTTVQCGLLAPCVGTYSFWMNAGYNWWDSCSAGGTGLGLNQMALACST